MPWQLSQRFTEAANAAGISSIEEPHLGQRIVLALGWKSH
jgi:hypothetical protein